MWRTYRVVVQTVHYFSTRQKVIAVSLKGEKGWWCQETTGSNRSQVRRGLAREPVFILECVLGRKLKFVSNKGLPPSLQDRQQRIPIEVRKAHLLESSQSANSITGQEIAGGKVSARKSCEIPLRRRRRKTIVGSVTNKWKHRVQ